MRSAKLPGNDSRRSFSQLGSLATSRTNEPSLAKVSRTCVRSRSCAHKGAARKSRAAPTADEERKENGTFAIIRAMPMLVVLLLLLLQTAPAPQKIDLVSVTGCLKETAPTAWTLVNSTDPIPSSRSEERRVGKSVDLGGRRRSNTKTHKSHTE